MKTKYVLLFVAAVFAVYSAISAFGAAPDVTLFKMFGYSFGINYSHNMILKLLFVGSMMIATMIIVQSKDENVTQKENA